MHPLPSGRHARIRQGDLMGVMTIKLPDAETQEAQTKNRAMLYTLAILPRRLPGDGCVLADRPLCDRQAAESTCATSATKSAAATSRCGPKSTPATSSRIWQPRSTACCAT